MKKDIKDYLHLYCNPFHKIKVIVDGKEEKYLWGIDVAEGGYVNITLADKEFRNIDIADDDDGWCVYNDDETLSRIKPILRPLSTMTEKEAIELVKISEWKQYGEHPHKREYRSYRNGFNEIVVSWGESTREKNVPVTKEVFGFDEFRFLLSKHFDLFGLIESGLAISKTKKAV